MSALYSARTGNGRAVHLSLVPQGRAVAALCGATVWSDAVEVDRWVLPVAVCRRCAKVV